MATPHATLLKFGYPDTCIHEDAHWAVLLRPQQATLGALVLVCKEDVLRYSALSAAAFAGHPALVRAIEAALEGAFGYQKINWMLLMMVDPHVHWHVLPRYDGPREFAGRTFTDPGWPALPQLAAGEIADAGLRDQLIAAVRAHWPAV